MENLSADNVATINGKSTAIEAKFVDDWSKSLRNPNSVNGSKPWAVAEQNKVVQQAKAYNEYFDNVVYHSNNMDFINYYSKVFDEVGIKNYQFILTPATR